MKPLSYIQFLWKSVNAHGVHSPFVYGFVANGLYSGQKVATNRKYDNATGLSRKSLKTLYRTISYFKSYKLIVLGTGADAATEAIRQAGEKANAKIWFLSPYGSLAGQIDLAYLTGTDSAALLPLLEQLKPDVSNHTVVAISNIHATPQMEAVWHAIKKDPAVTVTVDTYHMGLVFFRQGQAKQHFTVRTNTSKITDFLLGIRNLWGLLG